MARPCARNRNRAGQYVGPHRMACRLRMDFQQLGRNMKVARWNDSRRTTHRINRDMIAALDGQHGGARRVKVAPVAVGNASLEVMMGHDVRAVLSISGCRLRSEGGADRMEM